jgi:large subunit ribosomal protein L3
MVRGLWGRKVGMTQVFSKENKVVPVTLIDVANWLVTLVKNKERDGYDAVQVGCVKARYADETFAADWVKSPNKYFSLFREIKVVDDSAKFEVGQSVDASVLAEGDKVDITGLSKGCGFTGVVKRHNFSGARASHGATMGRTPGSLGFMRSQGKVIKGKKLPGHYGQEQQTIKNLKVVSVEEGAKVVLVKGSVPGKTGSLVFLRKV